MGTQTSGKFRLKDSSFAGKAIAQHRQFIELRAALFVGARGTLAFSSSYRLSHSAAE
jgi:hypothetical protein